MTALRIGFYHCTLPQPGRKPGGVAVFVDRLAAALVEAGHDVTVFTYDRPGEERPYRVKPFDPRAWRAARWFAGTSSTASPHTAIQSMPQNTTR